MKNFTFLKHPTLKCLLLGFILLINSFSLRAQTGIAPSQVGGVYQIAKLENLVWVAEQVNGGNSFSGENFIQTANIDASETSGWNAGAGWIPIGDGTNNFSGQYNGQGYTISNLHINRYAIPQDNIGLFGYCSNATIENIALTNVSISGNIYVGILMGVADNCVIQNCYSAGTVSGNYYLGGLIGYCYNSTVSKCYSSASVSALEERFGDYNDFGGFTGVLEGGTISNCYATGAVTGNKLTWIGGFAGEISSSGNITNCYSTGLITPNGSSACGGFVGTITLGTATDCFWDITTSGQNSSAGGTGKATAQMQSSTPFTGWSITNWVFALGNYPKLLWNTTIFSGTGNWSDAGRWSNGIPNSNAVVTINGACTIDGSFSADDLTLNSSATLTISTGKTLSVGGNLTLKSDAGNTASLINSGTLNVTGTTYAQRYMTSGKWHIVSPTAAGGSISPFIQATGNAIPIKDVSGTNNYGMMDYNEPTNAWKSYFTTSTGGTLTSGKGYSVRRTSDGVVTFTGTLATGEKTVALTKAGDNYGWNCVGNPYASAINMNTTAALSDNFITENSPQLDASYACVYVWDEDDSYSGQNCYKIISNTLFSLPGKTRLSMDYVAPGQGFFVKARTNTSEITFTPAMRSHQNTIGLKSAQTSWPGFELSVQSGSFTNSTIIAFNGSMTNGLDVTYDAGLLRKSADLNIYSRLVDDNGVDFAIQCLPESYTSLVIPLGLDCKTGGELIFSAETVELPAVCKVILEDKLTGTYTSLADGATYKTTVAAESAGIGRFYIHTSSSTTGVSGLPNSAFNLKAYAANGEIIIEGEVGSKAQTSLFDVGGRKIGQYKLTEVNRNSIATTGLAKGVYFLEVTEGEKRFVSKVVIY